jgi:hypothetical protein
MTESWTRYWGILIEQLAEHNAGAYEQFIQVTGSSVNKRNYDNHMTKLRAHAREYASARAASNEIAMSSIEDQLGIRGDAALCAKLARVRPFSAGGWDNKWRPLLFMAAAGVPTHPEFVWQTGDDVTPSNFRKHLFRLRTSGRKYVSATDPRERARIETLLHITGDQAAIAALEQIGRKRIAAAEPVKVDPDKNRELVRAELDVIDRALAEAASARKRIRVLVGA